MFYTVIYRSKGRGKKHDNSIFYAEVYNICVVVSNINVQYGNKKFSPFFKILIFMLRKI